MTCTVIVVTLNRPDCVRKCLERLVGQQPCPDQIILVDASTDDLTRTVADSFEGIVYLRNDRGYGHMTHGRNIGLLKATGDIVAFLDDDAYAHEDWLPELIRPYADLAVGGVGGRSLNNQPGEASAGLDQIGKVLKNGSITGNFAADPGGIIEVDHLLGCNMSWRRSALLELGGLREDYPGTEAREDTDIALRVRKAGYRLVFNPAAVVTHVGAPRASGTRFGLRAVYYGARNTALLFARNEGLGAPILWRFTIGSVGRSVLNTALRIAGAVAWLAAVIAGLLVGFVKGAVCVLRSGTSPKIDGELGAAAIPSAGNSNGTRTGAAQSAIESRSLQNHPPSAVGTGPQL